MKEKRGMSELITVISMISGAVLFVGIITVVFMNVIEKNSEQIQSQLNVLPGNNIDVNSDCKSNWNCFELGECIADYTFSEIINGVILKKGSQIRKCTDLNNCENERFEEISCSFVVPIQSQKVIWCGETYIEIYDIQKNILVSKIKEKDLPDYNFSRIDIKLISTQTNSYCDYCYNGIKDYDETNTDCGGSCRDCLEVYKYSDWVFFIVIILWIILFILIVSDINPLKYINFSRNLDSED